VNSQRLLTLLEVADMLRLSPHTIRAMVRQSRLRPLRLCRRVLFHPDEITRFLTQAQHAESASRDSDAQGIGRES
jgi:excisionase family DNA binding protein